MFSSYTIRSVGGLQPLTKKRLLAFKLSALQLTALTCPRDGVWGLGLHGLDCILGIYLFGFAG